MYFFIKKVIALHHGNNLKSKSNSHFQQWPQRWRNDNISLDVCYKLFMIKISCLYERKKQPPGFSVRKGILRNFSKFTGKHLCQSLRPATLLKKRLWHRPVSIVKFLRTLYLQKTSGRLLLNLSWRCWFSEAAVHRCFSK